jgi:hypothetical protein
MTVQPIFGFARNGRDGDVDDEDRPPGEGPSDGEKIRSPVADRTPSVSSFNSDEKQTFGVSKVEAITTVWTKGALITLYILYSPHFYFWVDMKYLPRLLCQFNATADYRTIPAICYQCVQLAFPHSGNRNRLQHYNGSYETSARKDPRCLWPI